jgi:hypothetical protein
MTKLNKVLKHFNNDLGEWVSFLNEKINDGHEISRGKDPHDVSKQQKLNAQPAEGAPEGGAEAAAPVPPIIDPSQAPGSQISIGKKNVKDQLDPESVKVEISGKKEKIDMQPRINTLPVNGTN